MDLGNYGTTEVVPCYKTQDGTSFSAASEVVPVTKREANGFFRKLWKTAKTAMTGW